VNADLTTTVRALNCPICTRGRAGPRVERYTAGVRRQWTVGPNSCVSDQSHSRHHQLSLRFFARRRSVYIQTVLGDRSLEYKSSVWSVYIPVISNNALNNSTYESCGDITSSLRCFTVSSTPCCVPNEERDTQRTLRGRRRLPRGVSLDLSKKCRNEL